MEHGSDGAVKTEPRARGPFLAQLKRAFERRGIDPSSRLSAAGRAAYQAADPHAWVDEELLVALLVVAKEVTGGGEAWKQLLREEASEGIQTFYRMFVRFMPPRMLFLGLGRMWSLTHSDGRVETSWLDQKRVRVSFLDHSCMGHSVYRDLSTAVLESLLTLNRTEFVVNSTEHGGDWLTVELTLGS